MPKFTVTLKRTYYAQVEIQAESAAEVRRIIAEGDNALDYIGTSDNIWGDDIKVSKIERPFATPEADAAERRRRETARDVQRIRAKHGELPDARDLAKTKGLKLWNGGGYGAVQAAEAIAHGHRDPSSVHVYACAKSRAELLRMIAAYQGLPGPERLQVGTLASIKNRWSEGNWGNAMDGVEPEPGLWVQWRHTEAPVRVWPKASTDAR